MTDATLPQDQNLVETPLENQPIKEKYPSTSHLRIVYAASKITENTDPLLAAVYSSTARVIAMQYFTMEDGTVGTAFFCVMKDEWKPPTVEEVQKNLEKLDEKPPAEEAYEKIPDQTS